MSKREELKKDILTAIQEKKGEEIVVIDLREGEGTITDYFILCSATSDKHAKAIADWVQRFVRKNTKEHAWKVEGYEQGRWIVLDYVDIIVHIFLPELRNYYSLESLWGDYPTTKVSNSMQFS